MQIFNRKDYVFNFLNVAIFLVFLNVFSFGCLITNCPRGGKRSGGKFSGMETNVKPCISCGPGNAGQCFGPSICCGPFGCLMGTPETARCQSDGLFHEREPCIAGVGYCRKNTGRCAVDGLCCNQDGCFTDKQCSLEEKRIFGEGSLDLYNFLGYQNEISIEK